MIYFNYLLKATDISNEFVQTNFLEQRDIRILEIIFLNSFKPNTHLKVNDVIEISNLGSRATIHRGLYRLRESKVIDFFHKPGNYRFKYLMPAGKAVNYFSKLEQIMLTAACPMGH
jgi:hypothetical protein